MDLITTLEAKNTFENKKNWFIFLNINKYQVENNFNWMKLKILHKDKSLYGFGSLEINGKKYSIELYYSPFNTNRFERIYIKDESIIYDDKIHLYSDMSLCLYHPVLDKPKFRMIPLYEIIPWITEWIVFYNLWKVYGIWLGKEIKHTF